MTARGPGLPPGGAVIAAGLAVLAGVKALGLVLVADGIARGVASIADGSDVWQQASALAATGALLRGGAAWATGVVAARGADRAKSSLRARLAERIARDGRGDGATAVLATEGLDGLDEYYRGALSAAIQSVVIPVALLARLLTADWLSVVVIALTLPLVPVFMALIGLHTRERAAAAARALDRLSDHLVELARGIPVLVGLGRMAEQTTALQRIQTEYRLRTRRTLRVAFLSALALELIATLSVAVVAVSLGIRLLAGDLPLATALLVLLLAPECFAVLRELGAAFHSAEDGRAAFRRAEEALASVVPHRPRRPGAGLRDLSVQFPDQCRPAVRLTASFRPGAVTAITGASGSGKSTALAALAGVLPADAVVTGTIEAPDAGRIGYAPQAPHAFAETIRDELCLYAADEAAADRLLAEVGLASIAELPTAAASPGELRRLAVARALLAVDRGAVMLLLDEPTAHLDPAAAVNIRAAIQRHRGSATVILVSHDPETLALADAFVRLDASRPELGGAGRAAADPAPPAAFREPAVEADAGGERPTRLLGALLRPDRGRWAIAVAWAVLAATMALALTAVSGWLIVRAASQVPIMYLLVAIVGVRFFGIGRALTRYLERLWTHDAALALADRLRLRLWSTIAANGAASRTLAHGGRALDHLITTTNEIRDVLPRLVPLATAPVAVASVLVTTVWLAPAAAPAVAAGAIATLATAVGAGIARQLRWGARRTRVRSHLIRTMLALGVAASDMRANGVERRALARLAALDRERSRVDRAAAWSDGASAAVAFAGTGALAALVLPLIAQADGRPEICAVLVLLILGMGDPITAAAAAAARLPALGSALQATGAVLQPPLTGAGTASLPGPARSIRLEQVAARWPGAATDAFHGATARVDAPAWLGIHGPSGSGKSTLLAVLMGALPTSAGRVRVAGTDLELVAPHDWRSRIAWCPQDAHVFDSTVRANLLIARPRTDPVADAEMRAVLDRLGLTAVIDRDGLDRRIGPGGRALSGGERQRLAVARALLSGADVLLLDEPTAHLDDPSASRMMADIRRAAGDRIVVLVSHRAADHQPDDVRLDLAPGTLVPAPPDRCRPSVRTGAVPLDP